MASTPALRPYPSQGRPSVQSPRRPHGPCRHCRICYSDTSGPQEDQYPPNIAVKVNHSYCSVPVSGAPWAALGRCGGWDREAAAEPLAAA